MKVASASLLLVLLAFTLRGATPEKEQKTELTAEVTDLVTVGNETRVICTRGPDKQVTLTGTNLRITCDRLEVIALGIGDKTSVAPVLERFKYLLATGNVVIVQGQREARCGRAEVLPLENKVVLTEDPVVIDHTSEFEQKGKRITMHRGDRRVIVEDSVLTGPSIKDLGFDDKQPAPGPSATAVPPHAPEPASAPVEASSAPLTVPGITPPK